MTDPSCDPGGRCITCSDEAVPMKVVSVGELGAACLDEAGLCHEGIAVELVGPVQPGDRVLVHAGVAIG